MSRYCNSNSPQDTVLQADNLSGVYDAFARIRVGLPNTLFDSKQLFDKAPLFWDEAVISGGGTSVSHSSNRASTTIGVTAATAGHIARQTFQRWNYEPGKSQMGIFTFVIGDSNSVGITKRVGLFDSNNGLFFQIKDGVAAFGIRSYVTGSPVDTIIPQSSWNVSKFADMDLTKAQIFFVDYEWLGVGTVRFGFFVDGVPVICHVVHNANVASSVYMSTPNLPARYEIINDGDVSSVTATFEHICTTVLEEGSDSDPLGSLFSQDRGTTTFTTASNVSLNPIISIRLKSTHLGASVIPLGFFVMPISTTLNFRYALINNGIVAGTDAASWTSIANSAVEYDISRDNTNLITGGQVLDSGYVGVGTSANSKFINLDLKTPPILGSYIDGTPTELILAVQNLSAATNTYVGGIRWKELL